MGWVVHRTNRGNFHAVNTDTLEHFEAETTEEVQDTIDKWAAEKLPKDYEPVTPPDASVKYMEEAL
jgi:hypothetical protein